MGAFLLGILFDESLRRWIIPWIRKDRERGHMLGQLCGALKKASTDGMYYMSGQGPGHVTPGASFTDDLKEAAAQALVQSFASELMSGNLGAVDEQCRAALRRHLEAHKRRSAMMGWGFHNPFRRSHSSSPALPAAPLPGPTPDNPAGGAPPPDDGGAEAAAAGMLGISLPAFEAMTGRRRRHHGKHLRHLAQGPSMRGGFSFSDLNPFASNTGRQLIQMAPGGSAATKAHDLVRSGRLGNHAALARIGHIKKKAHGGDRNASIALNHIKQAHTKQTGQHHPPTPGGGHWRQHYAAGRELMTLNPHHRRA